MRHVDHLIYLIRLLADLLIKLYLIRSTLCVHDTLQTNLDVLLVSLAILRHLGALLLVQLRVTGIITRHLYTDDAAHVYDSSSASFDSANVHDSVNIPSNVTKTATERARAPTPTDETERAREAVRAAYSEALRGASDRGCIGVEM